MLNSANVTILTLTKVLHMSFFSYVKTVIKTREHFMIVYVLYRSNYSMLSVCYTGINQFFSPWLWLQQPTMWALVTLFLAAFSTLSSSFPLPASPCTVYLIVLHTGNMCCPISSQRFYKSDFMYKFGLSLYIIIQTPAATGPKSFVSNILTLFSFVLDNEIRGVIQIWSYQGFIEKEFYFPSYRSTFKMIQEIPH